MASNSPTFQDISKVNFYGQPEGAQQELLTATEDAYKAL